MSGTVIVEVEKIKDVCDPFRIRFNDKSQFVSEVEQDVYGWNQIPGSGYLSLGEVIKIIGSRCENESPEQRMAIIRLAYTLLAREERKIKNDQS